jgi:probable rRNA maturation factor
MKIARMKTASIRIDLQNDSHLSGIPDEKRFEEWVRASLQHRVSNLEQTIRVVMPDESQQLNLAYRGMDKATNVLSFPAERVEQLEYDYLGDLVICAQLVESEALHQNKAAIAHWAHLVVHGMLHLQGLDHVDENEAEKMEALEIEILASLGHTNPY